MILPPFIRRAAVAITLALAAGSLAGCGSDAKTQTWVGTFCGAGSGLRTVLSGQNEAIKSQLSIPDLPPADLKDSIVSGAASIVDASGKAAGRIKDAGEPSVSQGTQIEAAAVSAYDGFDERAKALQTQAGALDATSANTLANGIGPYSQQVADLSRDVAGSFAGLQQFKGYPDLEKASKTPDDYGTADTCTKLQTVG